jgi:hypothetical protein
MRRVASVALASSLCVVAVVVSLAWLAPPPSPDACPLSERVDADDAPVARADATAALKGLWSRYPDGAGRDDAPVAFYYFHDGGIGLYRYGQVGFNTTNSYRWALASHHGATVLVLTYTKTGEVQHLLIRLDDAGRRSLTIVRDPRNPGASETVYVWMPPSSVGAVAPDLETSSAELSSSSSSAGRIDDRLWIDERRFKTGGMGFSLYQLRKAGIDGRGTGWHHVGDYDDWSTEALTYRLVRGEAGVDRLDLAFSLRGDRTTTPFRVVVDDRGARTLILENDPRDFQATHIFADGGPSFAGLSLSPVQ